jgi:hypothetical protein
MKLQYFFVCVVAAASLTVSPEIVLAHGEAVMVGEAEDTLLSVVVVTDLADSPAAALVEDSGGREDFLLVAEITAALVTVVSVDAIATFAVVVFAILMGTSSISASLGSDIRIITSTTTQTPISNYGAY